MKFSEAKIYRFVLLLLFLGSMVAMVPALSAARETRRASSQVALTGPQVALAGAQIALAGPAEKSPGAEPKEPFGVGELLSPEDMRLSTGEHRRIFDHAGLLSEPDRNVVQEALAQATRKLGWPVVVVTLDRLGGMGVEHYAEEFFFRNNIGNQGASPSKNGVMIVTATEERDIRFATFGDAIPLFQARADRIREQVVRQLSAKKYRQAFVLFAGLVSPANMMTKMRQAAQSWEPWAIAMVLTVIIMLLLGSGHRGAITVTNMTYADPNSFRLTGTEDRYLRTTTTKTKIERSSSSGSSGGGRRSGGSSGKF